MPETDLQTLLAELEQAPSFGGPLRDVLARWWAGVDSIVTRRLQNAVSREMIRKERLRALYREAARRNWPNPQTTVTPHLEQGYCSPPPASWLRRFWRELLRGA